MSDWAPEFAPWDGRRVPVTLLAGYLGAGKTTWLNALLADTDRPIAVIVNDIGAVNIDAALVRQRNGDTIELTDGCVCCDLARGLADTFEMLRDRSEPPDHLVVELSGAADPNRVVPWANSAGFRLDGTVVLVDADQFARQWMDPIVQPLLSAQLDAGDIVVLTKLDLASDAAIAEARNTLAGQSEAPIVEATGGSTASALLRLGGRRPGGVDEVPAPTLFDPHEVNTVPVPVGVSRAELDILLASLPEHTVRAKGIAQLDAGSKVLIQMVGSRITVEPLPQAEDQAATDLVVITLRTD